jgi:hypothetical protein
MKKLAILFLLTSLIGASAFALEGVGDFAAKAEIDLTDAAEETRGLSIKPSLSFSRVLIENLTLSAGVGVPFTTPLKKTKLTVGLDSFEVKLTYGGIAAGPGSLGFFLNNALTIGDFEEAGDTLGDGIDVGATYGGIVAGPGSLGLELAAETTVVAAGEGDFNFDDIYLDVTYGLDLGVAITVKPFLLIQPDVEFGGLFVKVAYTSEIFGAGVKVDKLDAGGAADFGEAFPIDVYGEAYLLESALTVGAHIKFANINGTGDPTINPGIYASYKF